MCVFMYNIFADISILAEVNCIYYGVLYKINK